MRVDTERERAVDFVLHRVLSGRVSSEQPPFSLSRLRLGGGCSHG